MSPLLVRFRPWLQLGRVSNLPTVWTNCLTAMVLSGADIGAGAALGAMLSMSAFYTAGMVLNDVFDANYDAKYRPARPIPSRQVTRRGAALVGFAGLGLGVAGSATVASFTLSHTNNAVVWTTLLALAIVGYDAYHKRNPLSPVLMGLCRALVVLSVNAMFVGETHLFVWGAAGLHCLYVAGLTYSAKQEDLARPGALWPVVGIFAAPLAIAVAWGGGWHFEPELHPGWVLPLTWGLFLMSARYGLGPLFERPKRIGVAVGRLIVGIAVLDALIIAVTGHAVLVAVALGCALLTQLGQRHVPGT